MKALIYRGLLSFGPDGKVRGELAEDWERDGDTGWRFHLRDASFHNGAPVTADDVKWTLERDRRPTSPTPICAASSPICRAIETPDAHTVRIIMKTPIVTLPLMLATPFAPIVAKDSLAAEGGAIGAGPYVLKSQERGVSLDLAAHRQILQARPAED